MRAPETVRTWYERQDEDTRRAARRSVLLLALTPLVILLASRAARIIDDPLLATYGTGVILTTGALMYLAFVRYRDPADDPPVDSDLPSVSCLVAVKDEVDTIALCVRSLLASTYPFLEVIVVDDGSTDGTTARLHELAAELSFHLIVLPENVGKKRALTYAVRKARGDILVFTDSDCAVAPGAVERCVRVFRAHPDVGAVSGHARALNRDTNLLTRVQDSWYDGQFGIAKAAESVFGSVTCVSGPMAAFRREAVYNYFPAWAGDTFLGQEFRFATDRQLTGYVLGQRWIGRELKDEYGSRGAFANPDYPERHWRVVYSRSARVRTRVPSQFHSMLRQQVRWKKSFIRNLFFTGTFQWRRGLGPAALYYAHAVWVLAAPFLAFRHLVWMPLQGEWVLSGLYLTGVLVKGAVWAAAYRAQNPRCHRWMYRPAMSVLSALVLSSLIVYSAITLKKSVWWRA